MKNYDMKNNEIDQNELMDYEEEFGKDEILTAEKLIPSYYIKTLFLKEVELLYKENKNLSNKDLKTMPRKVYDKMLIAIETEYLSTLELWPAVGAYCYIEECGKTQFVRSFNEYKSHFGSIHKEILTLYTCQICHLSRRKLQILKKHLVKDHKCSQNRYRCMDVTNKNFVDPKYVLPYRVGDANERKEAQQTREKVDERKRKAKEDAQETRKRYEESGKKPHVEDNYYNYRDERLTFNFDKNTLLRTVMKPKKH
ncbi:unnamed protein product [Mytilus coruscus]|uniref:Uncharacterized protein n=1 Tax=Mytilus coruscus TaxID=42192 RepID=A0A6J8DBC5_MYTCO|nr:unnamed protein product [Mytilus coruscus]